MLLILTAVLVGLLPGWLVAWAAGLRGLTALAGAPVLTYAVTAVGGPATTLLGLGWGPVPLGVATMATAGLCVALRWRRSVRADVAPDGARPDQRSGPDTDVRSGRSDRHDHRAIGVGILAGAALGVVTVWRGAGGFTSVHQGWDAAFHANAIRLVLDTGRADPASTGLLSVGQGEEYYYPNALHVLSAVVGRLTGADVPSLLTVQMMLLPGIAGLGLAVLVRRFGTPVAVAAVLPLLLASFSGLTYDLFSRGPLLPYATGLALIPGLMVLLDSALSRRRAALVLAAGLAAAGLLAVHPGAALSAALIGVLLVAQRGWGSPRRLRHDLPGVAAVGGVALVCGLPYVIGLLATGESGVTYDWPVRGGITDAIRNLVLVDPGDRTPQYLLLALVLVGVLGIARVRALWWWLAGGAAAAVGFVAVSVSDAPLVERLSQPWWNDRWRFLALIVLAVAPLAAHGLVLTADGMARLIRWQWPGLGPDRTRGLAVLGVLAVLAGSGLVYGEVNRDQVARSYVAGPTVSAAEQAAMAELAAVSRSTGSAGRVMNDPGDGSAWMYALDGMRPVFGFSVDTDDRAALPADQGLLMESFRCLDSDPAIRELVRRYDIAFVYTGPGFLRDRFERIPGLQDLAEVRSLHPVYASGGAAIYVVRLTTRALPPVPGSPCAPARSTPDAG